MKKLFRLISSDIININGYSKKGVNNAFFSNFDSVRYTSIEKYVV